jgi:hypothetical protein
MYTKSLGIAIVLAIALLSANSFAQSRSAADSKEAINTSDLPNGAIVIIKSEATESPEYLHTQYVFLDQSCGSILVDHYGPPVSPNDQELKQVEQRVCTEIATNSRDGD